MLTKGGENMEDYEIFEDYGMFEEYGVFWLVGIICASCIFGVVTKTINESKGYKGGFAWGFWLSWFGVIVVACKPQKQIDHHYPYNNIYENGADLTKSWICPNCQKLNPNYIETCNCGLPISKKEEFERFKSLYEKGIITQHDYNFKVRTLLNK